MAPQPLLLDGARILAWVSQLWWPVLRVSGFMLAAPVLSAAAVPRRIRIALTVGVAFLLAPRVAIPPELSIFTGVGALTAVKELLLGVAIGMVVELAFEAIALAGQTVSMTMGLGFATLLDPQRGGSSTVVGQMFTLFAFLSYLSVGGHLRLLAALGNSFQTLPIGNTRVGPGLLEAVALWGGQVFEAGLQIALPAVIALLIVNLALGVVTRAAPQLNIFGVGFPLTLLSGFLILIFGIDGIMDGTGAIVSASLDAIAALVP